MNTNSGTCEHDFRIQRLGMKRFGEFPKKMILLSMIMSTVSPALTETPLQSPRGSANTWRVDLRLDPYHLVNS